jgi:CBS-domain-containing membrane protein
MIDVCMKRNVVSVSPTITVREAAHLVVERHIGTLPVVDTNDVLMGMVRIEELLEVFMPDFVALLDNIDFVHDFGAMETPGLQDLHRAASLTMRDLMQPPVAVDHTCGLLRAFATLLKHDIRDLLVVDQAGRLVGIASRVDIAAAFLAEWSRQAAPS